MNSLNLTICPDRESWLAERRSGIGASDAPAILGLSSFRSPLTVWAEKVHAANFDSGYSDLVKWGHLLEGPVREEYQRLTGRKVEHDGDFAIARHPETEWLTATLDGRIVDDRFGVYEGKTCIAHQRHNWDEGIPVNYQVQTQHQMLVTGASWASVAVLIGGNDFRYYDVPRDDGFIETTLLPELERFWNLVVTQTAPEVDGSEATARTIKALHPEDNGQTILLDDFALGMWDRMDDLKEQIKPLTEEREALKHQLKLLLGDNTYGLLPDGSQLSCKTQTRKEYVVKESTSRVLRHHK